MLMSWRQCESDVKQSANNDGGEVLKRITLEQVIAKDKGISEPPQTKIKKQLHY